MKKTIPLLYLLFTTVFYAQKEGQNYCEGDAAEGYFTLLYSQKNIVWFDTYYTEVLIGEQVWNGKTYKKYVQEWEEGAKDTIYLREEGTRILEYNATINKEIIRFDTDFRLKKQWKGKEVRYTLLSFTEELDTPICRYKNLMAIEAKYPNVTYVFYYLKGFGYVAATKQGKLISFACPDLAVIEEYKRLKETSKK